MDEIKTIVILFDDSSSHADVIKQFVEKLHKAKFASKREILEELKDAEILIK